jgi:D-serine deaminase-like pyridoxal phosphate-dependent protein
MQISNLETPVLTVDLDALETNLDRYQRYFTQHGIGLRPHIKTHKTVAVAHMQMRRGAVGLACQKIGEAEVMVNGGLDQDILIPYNIIGADKLDRLVALAKRTKKLTVSVDSAYTVEGLSAAFARAGLTIGVLVDMEVGMKRTGVPTPGQAVELAQKVDQAPGLELRGLMLYPTPPATRPLIQEALDLFDRKGLPHPMVSGGSTPNAMLAEQIPELTEYRAGEYPMGGHGYLLRGSHTVEQCALRVLATVVSRPDDERCFLDCGSKTLSASIMKTEKGDSVGYIVEYPDARLHGYSEEHGHVDISACARKPEIGERVTVLPVHPCPCVNEHDQLVATRGGAVEAIWPVLARGKIR